MKDLKLNTQSETIIWHDARKDFPPDGWVLVDIAPDHDIDMTFNHPDEPLNTIFWQSVIAWAEMPKGWKE